MSLSQRGVDARSSQRQRLGNVRHAEPASTGVGRSPGHGDNAVALRIGLHHGHNRGRGCKCDEVTNVVPHCGEVDGRSALGHPFGGRRTGCGFHPLQPWGDLAEAFAGSRRSGGRPPELIWIVGWRRMAPSIDRSGKRLRFIPGLSRSLRRRTAQARPPTR